jgi:hypothetical protein
MIKFATNQRNSIKLNLQGERIPRSDSTELAEVLTGNPASAGLQLYLELAERLVGAQRKSRVAGLQGTSIFKK